MAQQPPSQSASQFWCPRHPEATPIYTDRAWRCAVCSSHVEVRPPDLMAALEESLKRARS